MEKGTQMCHQIKQSLRDDKEKNNNTRVYYLACQEKEDITLKTFTKQLIGVGV